MSELTFNCIEEFFNNKIVEEPIVQIISIKDGGAKFGKKIVISDGVHFYERCCFEFGSVDDAEVEKLVVDAEANEYPIIKFLDWKFAQKTRVFVIQKFDIVAVGAPLVNETVQFDINNNVVNVRGFVRKRISDVQSAVETKKMKGSESPFVPICSLNTSMFGPYHFFCVILRKTVLVKSEKTPCVTLHVADDNKDDIKIVAYGDYAVLLNSTIVEEETYRFSGSSGSIRSANPQYCMTKSRYEIFYDRNSSMSISEKKIQMPELDVKTAKLIKLGELAMHDKDTVNAIVVVYNMNMETETGGVRKSVQKLRVLNCVDSDGTTCVLNVWNQEMKFFEKLKPPFVLVMKNVLVSKFKDTFSLSSTQFTYFYDGTNDPIYSELFEWFKANVAALNLPKIDMHCLKLDEELRVVKCVSSAAFKDNIKDLHFNVIGFVSNVSTDGNLYEKCAICHKKVHSENGKYKCDGCMKESDKHDLGIRIRFEVNDDTGIIVMIVFDEQAKSFFGIDAPTLKKLEEEDRECYERMLKSKLYSFVNVRARVRKEHFNGNTTFTYIVQSIAAVDAVQYQKCVIKGTEFLKSL
uniref:Replication factor A C-terminal domain-containing protein n=1 Tax=Panagrolaimus sp. JU765 TaxID=591449 RepID=A0AC34Q487_9BILA